MSSLSDMGSLESLSAVRMLDKINLGIKLQFSKTEQCRNKSLRSEQSSVVCQLETLTEHKRVMLDKQLLHIILIM